MTNAELNRAVAIEVMGWTERHHDCELDHALCMWVDPASDDTDPYGGVWHFRVSYEGEPDFAPSTDWLSAGVVIEKLLKAGSWIELRPERDEPQTEDVVQKDRNDPVAEYLVRRDNGVAITIWHTGPRLAWQGFEPGPHLRALCLAALAAARSGALETKSLRTVTKTIGQVDSRTDKAHP